MSHEILNLFAIIAGSGAILVLLVKLLHSKSLAWASICLLYFSLLLFMIGNVVTQGLQSKLGLAELILSALAALFLHLSSWAVKIKSLESKANLFEKTGIIVGLILILISFILSAELPFLPFGSMVFIFVEIVYIIIVAIKRTKSLSDLILQRVLADLFVVTLVFVPFFVVDMAGTLAKLDLPGFLIDDYSLPTYFVVFNSVLIIRLVGWLLRALSPKSANTSLEELWSQYSLSTRETQVARELSLGKSSKEIAQILAISPKTVENHTYKVFSKMGISSRFEFLSLVQRSLRS